MKKVKELQLTQQEWFDATEERRAEILQESIQRLDPEAYDYWEEMYEYKKEEQEGS